MCRVRQAGRGQAGAESSEAGDDETDAMDEMSGMNRGREGESDMVIG